MSRKFALVTLEFPPHGGGVARMYGQIAQALGQQLDIYVQTPLSEQRVSGVQYLQLIDTNYRLAWWPAIKLIWRLGRSKKYDAIVIGHVLPLGTAAWLVSWFVSLKYYIVVHGMDITVSQNIWRKKIILRVILKGAKGVIAANKNIAKITTKLSPKAIVSVIYPAPGITTTKPSELVKHLVQTYDLHKGKIILTVARLVPRKGISFILEAMNLVWQTHPDAQYIIVGNGPEEENLRQQILSLSRSHQVHLLTKQSDQEIAAWYDAADIFVLTPYTLPNADTEGLGIVYLEAGLHGLPVIGSNHGGVPEAIVENVTGILVPEHNVNLTAGAIVQLLDDDQLRAEMGDNAQKYIRHHFNTDIMRQKLTTLLYD